MEDRDPLDAVVDAALRLASAGPWSAVTLSAIAAEAGTSLAALARHASSKADILMAFSRRVDRALLASVETDPVEGEAHDRLFDVMLRRIELLTPHKPAVASIMAAPASGPTDWPPLMAAALESQGWCLAAAGIDAEGTRGELRKLALARIHAEVLRIWLDDADPGMARTMAALDRKLRDGEELAKRIETPIAIVGGLLKAWRDRRKPQPEPKPADDASHATAD